ncbi:MAG: rRNA pseudouridine synthase [Candidatus Accumulibacter phosphatis]|uniref:pseudouridine synthase n=1 Tax=Candidatus Accumulibacter phosphatis TaxID=327160 RepID=UPI001A53849F|nr:rRNA pseudouridine synthase [Candidatus Accumulibacter phosphatis]
MPRSILKLPRNTVTTHPVDRSPTRKPIRGGSKATTRWPQKVDRDNRAPGSAGERPWRADAPDKGAEGGPTGGRAADQPGKTARPAQPGRAAKTHPPRGIARSTGARAAPPVRAAQDAVGERLPAMLESRLPPVPADPTPPAMVMPEAATAGGRQRGLAKEPPRLSKLVSQLALCSRREADEWIENGWVTVDGVVVTRLGARVSPKAKIEITNAASQHQTASVTIVFNKPIGDAEALDTGLAAIATLIRPDTHWVEDGTCRRLQASHLRGLAVAGKLDTEEHGMVVFTQDGSAARRLTGGGARLENEYHLRVQGELSPDGLQLLRHGLSLDNVRLERAQVSWLSEQQLRFVVYENRKRQIQRQCELVGLQVTDIKRVRIGGVSLGKLPPGQWRYLRPDERF